MEKQWEMGEQMRLGDWTPPGPLQGVHLTPVIPGLYSMRAVSIMGPAQDATVGGVIDVGDSVTHIDPMPDGIRALVYVAPAWRQEINCTEGQARAFAAHYGGVMHKINGNLIIKAIAPAMRKMLRLSPRDVK